MRRRRDADAKAPGAQRLDKLRGIVAAEDQPAGGRVLGVTEDDDGGVGGAGGCCV